MAGPNSLGTGLLPIATPLSKIDLWLKHLSSQGNALIVTEMHGDASGSITATVTDSLGQTYLSAVAKIRDATDQQSVSMWYVPNSLPGVSKITVTFSTTTEFCMIRVSEFNNIALTGVTDGSSSATVAGPGSTNPYQAGSITTTQDGDLIYCVGFGTSSAPSQITSYTAGVAGKGFTLLDADHQDDAMSEYQIQSVHGAINADFRQNPGTQTHVVVACAFRSADTGTPAPGGIRVVRLNHNNLWNDNGGTVYNFQFPCSGNLLIATLIGIQASPLANVGISTITDSNLNSWVLGITVNLPSAAAGQAEIWYAKNAVTSPNMTVQVTFTRTQSQSDLLFYDISGASSNPLGATTSGTGLQTVNANLDVGALKPTTPWSLLIGVTGINSHTISGTATTGFLNDTMVYPEADGARGFDEDNGRCHFFVGTDLSSQEFIWTVQHDAGGTQDWTFVAAEFKPAPFAAGPTTSKRIALQHRIGEG